MDFNLNADQLAFIQAASDFATHALAPHAAQWDEEKHFPRDVIAQAGDLGFCGLYAPTAHGGLGLTRLDAALIFEALAMGCTSTTAYLTIHNMATWMVTTWGNADLCAVWGEALTSGKKLASYCLTEANAGSDAASLKTTAILDDDTYVLNGSKAFISGAGSTDLLVVMARTGDAGAKGISAFAVPATSAGISYGKNESKMGWNSQPTRTINFDQVRIPQNHLLGQAGEGFKIAMKGLDGGRINIASCSLGAAQAALQEAQTYLLTRQQFGQSLAQFQALQFRLADMLTQLIAARQMVRLAAFKLDQRDSQASTYCAMAKRFATDTCFQVCDDALQLFGGYGYIREYPLERYLRDTRVHRILEGTNEIMRLIVARAALVEDALLQLR